MAINLIIFFSLVRPITPTSSHTRGCPAIVFKRPISFRTGWLKGLRWIKVAKMTEQERRSLRAT